MHSKFKTCKREALDGSVSGNHDFDCGALLGIVLKKQKVVQSFSFRMFRVCLLEKEGS